MERAARLLRIQHAVTDALARPSRLDEAARRFLTDVTRALGWKVGALWLVDEAASVVRCHDMWSDDPRCMELVGLSHALARPPGIGLPGRVWSRRESEWVPDVITDTNFLRGHAAAKGGLHAAFAVPILSGDRIIGALEFFDSEVRETDPELLAMFASIGSQLGQAIERIRAEERLGRSEASLRGIVEGALDGVIVMDAEGRIVEWNAQAELLFGWARTEVLGRALGATIFTGLGRERHRSELWRFARTDQNGSYVGSRVETVAVHRSGRPIEVELAITPVRMDGAYTFSVVVRDIGPRRRQEARLRLLAEAGSALSASLDYERTLRQVAELAVSALADHCVIHVTDERGVLRRVAIESSDESVEQAWSAVDSPETLDAVPGHAATEAFTTRRPVFFPEVGDLELERLGQSAEHGDLLRSLRLLQWLYVPLDAPGGTLGVMGFGISRPERRWDEQDLELAGELARRAGLAVESARLYALTQEAVRTRDEFLATVSHDLRNPLASIKGLAQLLRRRALRLGTPETDSFVESLERVDAGATKMTNLLNELVEVSGLAVGQPLELSRERVDLVRLVRDAARPFVEEGRHEVEILAEPEEIGAEVDASRLERVVTNLLTNAAKYSPRGGRITISVSTDGNEAVVAVRDEGIGIPERDLPHVFERYRRGSNVTNAMPGTGIGLTAAKQLVELHRGTIEARSVEGEGSTFTMRIPLGTASDPERTESSEVEA